MLGRKSRRGKGDIPCLGSHSDTEEQPAYEELGPRMCETRPDDGEQAENSGEEDRSATAKVVIQGVAKPAAAVSRITLMFNV